MAAPGLLERVQICLDHLEMSVKWKGDILGVAEMKRHYTNYFKGISHFKDYRMKLVTSFDLQEIRDTLKDISERADEFEFV
jgi:tRNA-dihydrouridine synthase B